MIKNKNKILLEQANTLAQAVHIAQKEHSI
jgi:hypothetical protein